jgi:hypothetical protein
MVLDKVGEGLKQFLEEKDHERRLRWLKQLAPTRDPRVAVVLGELVNEAWTAKGPLNTDEQVADVAAARDLLERYYMPPAVQDGKTDPLGRALRWWRGNRDDLHRRAKQLP